jgi:sterol desaturase/sphingolipid hydroxylase (fatty acid hydroxylase superfamily)
MTIENLPDLTVVAIPLYILTMSVEVYAHWRRPRPQYRGYSWRDAVTSLTMGLGSLVIGAAFAGIQLAFLTFFAQFAVMDLGELIVSGSAAAIAAGFVVLFVLDDFCYYWFHRVHHESRLFWAAHVTHHSSQYYNLSTALRQSWTPLTSWIFYVPVVLLGFTPGQWAFVHATNLLYQYWIHTERIRRMPVWFEFVFNYLDSNYGGILIVWDRVFGSFVPEQGQVVFGLTKNIETFNPVKVAWHEFYDIGRDVVRARTWRERWLYTFGPPGWTPQGRDLSLVGEDNAPT